ncbi:MAG: gliding motility-associated C-terminal domain-containing protein [Bacteroidia bacterium]|nr:gliding motility-associated C-terminal domain-containing protein [Bacteroidia bacterium]
MNICTSDLLRYGFSVFFLSLFLFYSRPVHATHIVGADLTYSCLNSATNTYDVNLTVYRDAINGVSPFDNVVTIFIFESSTGNLFNTQDVFLPPGVADTLPVDAAACTGAQPNIRIEFKTYNFQITLPAILGGYDIGWARCCRNNAITNIANNQGITVSAHIPGTEVNGCNSSPLFNQVPPTFLCLNQPFFFDYSATDADGDSLVYQISNPFGGINLGGLGVNQFNPTVTQLGNQMGAPPYLNLNFSPGFSFTDPFGSGNFNIDPQSGLLSLTPNTTGISVFAVSVLEYRDGVLISENKRDFQIQVINCNALNAPPVFTKDMTNIPINGAGNPSTGQPGNGILAISGDTIFTLPTANFCFDLSLTDPVSTDTVEMFAVSNAFGIGGTAPPPFATLTSSGINPSTGSVCWQIPCQSQGDTVMLIVGGRDINDCEGYNLVFDTTFVVVVETRSPTISHTSPQGTVDTVIVDPNVNFCYTLGAGDQDTFDVLEFFPIEGPFNGLGGSGPFATITTIGTNPMIGQVCWTPPCELAGQTVRFVVGVQDNNFCFNQAFDTVVMQIRDLPTVGVLPSFPSCQDDSITLVAVGGTAYSWTPATGLSNTTIERPRAAPTDTTTYTVVITDSVGCPRVDSIRVDVWALPPVDAGPNVTVCRNGTIQLSATGGVIYFWDRIPGLNIYDVPNPIASPDSQTVYVVTAIDTNGCRNRDSLVVTPMYAIAGPDQTICAGDSVQLTASGGNSYQWTPTGNIINANTANPTVFPTVTTTYRVTVMDSTGCTDVDSLVVNVTPPPNISFGPTPILCIGDSFQLAASGGVDYLWDSSPTLIFPDSANPVVFPSVPTVYYLNVLDSLGCQSRDSVFVDLHPIPMADAGADTVKCGIAPIQLSASGGVSYAWESSTSLSDTSISNPFADPLVNTTYYLNIIDANGCSGSDSVFVRVWEANAGPDLEICFGDSTALQATEGVAYSWDPSPFLINPNSPNAIVFPNDTSSFFVTITDTSGCTDRDTVQVNVLPPPTITFNPANPQICSGDSLTLGASGGISYAWSPANLLNDSSLSNPGVRLSFAGPAIDTTYLFPLTIEDARTCRNTDTLELRVRRLPIIGIPADTSRCPGDSIALTSLEGSTFSWSPGTFISSTNTISTLVFPDTSTLYTVVVQDSLGCTDSAQTFVRVNQLLGGPDETICENDSVQLDADLEATSYVWSPTIGLSNPNIRNPFASPLVSTTYEVSMTDSAGCVHLDTVLVFVNPAPVINAGRDSSICFGDSLQLNASGAVQYRWNTSLGLSDSTIANPFAFPTSSSNFVVVGTDANGCSASDSINVNINALPIADAGPDRQIKCGQDSLQLNASGGISYQWTPALFLNDPGISNPRVAPDSSQVYSVLVTDANGCSNTDSVEVLSFYVEVNNDLAICPGEAATLIATAINGQIITYDWQPDSSLIIPGLQSVQANPLSTTNYFLTATDSSGCVDTASVVVTVRVGPIADAGQDTSICIGESIQLTGSGGVRYAWQPVTDLDNDTIPNPLATPITSTTYFLEVSDSSSCTGRDSVRITVNPLPIAVANVGGEVTKCGDQTVQLQATGGISYRWTPALGLDNDSISNPIASPDSSTIYTVAVTDTNGCSNTDSVRVNTFYALAGPDQQLCPGEISQMAAAFDGGLAVSYAWEPLNLVDTPTDPNTLFSVTQDTAFIVTVTDSSGCSDVDTMSVQVFPSPVVDAGDDQSICIGERVDLRGTGAVSYTWTPITGLDNPNIATPTAGPLETTTYFLAGIDTNNCVGNDSITVFINPLPEITVSTDTTICEGNLAFLTASGGQTYSWSPDQSLGSPNSAETTAFPDLTTTYTVVGTDSNSCQNQAEVTVNVEEAPSLTGDTSDSICVGGVATLSVSGAPGYLWSTGERSSSIEVAPGNTQDYWVVPQNPLGCPGDTLFINVYVERNLPIAAFEADPTEGPYPLTVNFSNQSRFSNSFTWFFGTGDISNEASPSYVYNEPGNYEVRLIADNGLGCPDEFNFRFIIAQDASLVIPKAFTPNGDGINDEFTLASNSFENFNFQIFNRWGRLIYEATDPGFRWDGSFQGEQVPEGVYVFKFNGTTFRGEQVDQSGTITVMR